MIGWKRAAAAATATLVVTALAADREASVDNTPSETAARLFLDSLTPKQRLRTKLPFDDEERLNWHYVPRDRYGLTFGDMSDVQRQAAHRLLKSGLSGQGYLKAAAIIQLEAVLRELESTPEREAVHRDPDRYCFTIFGDPEPDTPWGWRVEGHHLSLNFSAIRNDLVATTPAFLGANPATVRSGPHTGLRPLADEEDLAWALLNTLDDTQLKTALIRVQAPRDIIMTPDRDEPTDPAGLLSTQMGTRQRELLVELIHVYVDNARWDIAKTWHDRIDAELDKIRFAWAGSLKPGKPHYYRVQGPSFIIEYDNVQNQANHAHAVWRDIHDDFGRNLLREHHEKHHAEENPD
jgi:hypothetical protein